MLERHGRLDILINNAGITTDKTVLNLTDDDWHTVIAVNLSGAFFMSRAALPHMLERGSGRIVNIASIIGETGNIGQANYAASKSGLFGLTKRSRARSRSRSSAPASSTRTASASPSTPCPPGSSPPKCSSTSPRRRSTRSRRRSRSGGSGKPDEIARVVHFLVADQSSFITGATWDVNGGMDM